MKSTVFIDGSSGTTGLLIEEKLVEHEKITLLKLKETEKKNIQKKSEIVNQCDLVIFVCLMPPQKKPFHLSKTKVQKS